ncbi:MAG TPA: penicillin-binding transpeptidase domain-containing protein [Ktedonobacteraceae bacterium]|nr:penicillin-binding transpeptidase domain-containing protein [Ktedonobacteraceae bacterium]
MNNLNANISASIRKVTLLFVALFVALSGGLVYWQVVVADQVTANIHNGRHCLSDVAPERGKIFDRNGVLLAYSTPSPNGCGYVRHYTDPSLAGVIGYYISPLFSSTGIEHQYEAYLDGSVGVTKLGNLVNQTLHLPPVGDNIYLTIDDRIQRAANEYFDKYAAAADNLNIFPSDRGSIIIMDPHTGEVLAMVSRPGFDPNRVASGDLNYYNQLVKNPEQPLLERPIQATYVPGSTYKTMTLMAALDAGSTQLTDEFSEKQALGPVVIGGETFGPSGNNISTFTSHYPVNVAYGFAHSDNIIFAQIGAKLGIDTWLNYNKKLYVGQQIPFDLPVTPSSVTPKNGQPLQLNGLAENSFGQGVDDVTPLQMSLIDNTVANNGTLMRPTLVYKIVDPNGSVLQSFNPQVLGNPISSQTAAQVRTAMLGVVRCGSGRFGDPGSVANPDLWTSPYQIIAKTGTGQVGGNLGAESWVISQAPYSNPRLTIVSMKENAGEGGLVNGPIITQLYNYIFSSIPQYKMAPVESTDINQLTAQDNNYCAQTGLLQ